MSDHLTDYQRVRAHVEARLAPMLRLHRQRMWLFVHIFTFLILNVVLWGWTDGPGYYTYQAQYIDGYNSVTNTPTFNYYTAHAQQGLALLFSIIWFLLLVFHGFSLWSAFRRERLIQRQIDHELELERLRLMTQLSQRPETHDTANGAFDNQEKPKRRMALGDDGELIADDDLRQSVTSTARQRLGRRNT